MSDPEKPHDTWSSLLSELHSSILTGHETTLIPNETAFHQAFNDLCAAVRERDPTRLLARFLRQHDQLIAFIGALDESIGFKEPDCLSTVFWSVAFITVDVSLSFRLLLSPDRCRTELSIGRTVTTATRDYLRQRAFGTQQGCPCVRCPIIPLPRRSTSAGASTAGVQRIRRVLCHDAAICLASNTQAILLHPIDISVANKHSYALSILR
jgi:hypothetical protein